MGSEQNLIISLIQIPFLRKRKGSKGTLMEFIRQIQNRLKQTQNMSDLLSKLDN